MKIKFTKVFWGQRGADIVALLSVALLVGIAFRLFLFEGWTFVGDSDRLNTFLNIRKFEFDGIRDLGYVPAWNERTFMGVSTMGLHYMLPGAGIFAYLEAMFPEPYLFRLMTFVSISLVMVAGWAAYFFIKDVSGDELSAFTGSVLYCMSVYALHRIAQLDSSFAVLIHLPIGMLLIRRLADANRARIFVGLAMLIGSLLIFTFLQEVAYVLVLFGSYACYQAFRKRSLLSIYVFGLATGVAVIIASPRLLTVFLDMVQLYRTHDMQTTSWMEVFRFFSEGIFGRFQGEGQSLANGINLHEGLQLIGSTWAAFLVVMGAVLSPFRRERWAALLLLAILSLVIWAPLYNYYQSLRLSGSYPSVEATIIIVNALALGICWVIRESFGANLAAGNPFLRQTSHSNDESVFHLLFLCCVIAVVLISEARYLFYLAFMKVDFTHARFSIAGLLPLCTLVAIYLGRLMPGLVGRSKNGCLARIHFVLIVSGAAFAVWLIEGPPLESWLAGLDLTEPIKIGSHYALPLGFARVFAKAGLFLLLLGVVPKLFTSLAAKQWVGIGLSFLIILETATYAEFKVIGPHTTNHLVPFEKNNYLNVPPGVLNPPTKEQSARLQQQLESDRYRSILVAPPGQFPAFVSSHFSSFWELRLLDGYGAGVPLRLGSFQWPGTIRGLRSISFQSAANVPWALLGLLNVKYAVFVDQALYYNAVVDETGQGQALESPDPKVQENPYEPLPRHFFVQRVTPGRLQLPNDPDPTRVMAPTGVIVTGLENGTVHVGWSASWMEDITFNVESRKWDKGVSSGSEFGIIGRVGASGRTLLSTNLKPGESWQYRMQACGPGGCSEYSPTAEIIVPVPGVSKPDEIKVKRKGLDVIEVKWMKSSPTAFYRVERQHGPDDSFHEVAVTKIDENRLLLEVSVSDLADAVRLRACELSGCSAHTDAIALVTAFISGSNDRALSEKPLPLPVDLRSDSFAEGFPVAREFPTDGTVNVEYRADHISVLLDPSKNERFLVLNELYHSGWQAFANGKQIDVYPTNIVMRGIVVPVGVTTIDLRFVPLLYRWQFVMTMCIGVLLLICVWFALYRRQKTDLRPDECVSEL